MYVLYVWFLLKERKKRTSTLGCTVFTDGPLLLLQLLLATPLSGVGHAHSPVSLRECQAVWRWIVTALFCGLFTVVFGGAGCVFPSELSWKCHFITVIISTPKVSKRHYLCWLPVSSTQTSPAVFIMCSFPQSQHSELSVHPQHRHLPSAQRREQRREGVPELTMFRSELSLTAEARWRVLRWKPRLVRL